MYTTLISTCQPLSNRLATQNIEQVLQNTILLLLILSFECIAIACVSKSCHFIRISVEILAIAEIIRKLCTLVLVKVSIQKGKKLP